MDITGLSWASDGHQPWKDGGMTDRSPHPASPNPAHPRDLAVETLGPISQTLAPARPQTQDSFSGEASSLRGLSLSPGPGTKLEEKHCNHIAEVSGPGTHSWELDPYLF